MRSTTTDIKGKTKPTSGDGDDVLHIVSGIQSFLGAVLHVKAPRALCGASLREDPDTPCLGPGAPQCPACVRINGRPGEIFVPRYQVFGRD